MGAPNDFHAGFRQAEMLDLALLDQIPDSASDFFNRHIRVDTVLVEQIDIVGTQTLERLFDSDDTDAFWSAIRPAAAALRRRQNQIWWREPLGREMA